MSGKRVYQELARRGMVERNMLKRIHCIIEVPLRWRYKSPTEPVTLAFRAHHRAVDRNPILHPLVIRSIEIIFPGNECGWFPDDFGAGIPYLCTDVRRQVFFRRNPRAVLTLGVSNDHDPVQEWMPRITVSYEQVICA